MMRYLQEINNSDDFEKAINPQQESRLVVIVFEASWCGPCKLMHPIVNRYCTKYSDTADFYCVQVDTAPELAKKCKVEGLPTYALHKKGEVVDRVIGANPAVLKQAIDSHKSV